MPGCTGLCDERTRAPRRLLGVAMCAALLVGPIVAQAQSAAPPARSPGTEPASSPAESAEIETDLAAPVLLGGEPVVWIMSGLGPYTPQIRAERIAQRLETIVHDPAIHDPRVVITEAEDSSELRVGPHLLMVVTARDAKSAGVARPLLAGEAARAFEAAIRAERLRYSPATLMRSGAYGAIATVLLAVGIWLAVQLTRWIHRNIARWRQRWLESLRVQQAEVVSAERLTRVIERLTSFVRMVLILVLLNLYLTFVLGLFPWTRAVSVRLLDYLLTPVRALTAAFIGYLPKLLFVLVIAGFIYVLIRLVGAFFSQVRHERIVFPNFPAEWAEPTNKIARALLIAFGLVVAFPYLPASDSPAFAGVSVFIGVLISLASSSALSNAIAGLVLTYTGAFRLGDRVRVGESYGDIVQTSLLATRVRTIKNEEITIPNAIVLNSAVTNFSRDAKSSGLILHTSVTIGYDAPWRTIHALLVQAALATPGVLREPSPFVWQTALNDFHVTYELNARIGNAQEMDGVYAALHERIQDAFFEAGVEIMSPHYTSVRDGNVVAIPPSYRSPEYEAQGLRVEAVVSTADGAERARARARPSQQPATESGTGR